MLPPSSLRGPRVGSRRHTFTEVGLVSGENNHEAAASVPVSPGSALAEGVAQVLFDPLVELGQRGPLSGVEGLCLHGAAHPLEQVVGHRPLPRCRP